MSIALTLALLPATGQAKQLAYVTGEERSSVAVIDTDVDAVVDEIPLSLGMQDVAVTADRSRAYVLDFWQGSVVVVDLISGRRIDEIPVGRYPRRIALTADARLAYVIGYPTVEIDLITGVVTPVLDQCLVQDVEISGDGRLAYVACVPLPPLDSGLAVIDTLTHQVFWLAPGFEARGVALSPSERFIYLSGNESARAGGRFAVIDSASLRPVLDVALPEPNGTAGVEDIAVSQDGGTAYISREAVYGDVAAIDTTTGELKKSIRGDPSVEYVAEKRFAVPAGSSHIFVTGLIGGAVSAVDTATQEVVANLHLGREVAGIGASPDGHFVYALAENGLHVIDPTENADVGVIPSGVDPTGIAASPDGRTLYVANQFSGNVSVLDAERRSVAATVQTGGHPHGAALTPDGRRLYVTSFTTPGRVFAIDTETNEKVATITVPGSAGEIAVAPDGTRVFVSNYADDGSLSVIDVASNTVAFDFDVGPRPKGIAFTADGSLGLVATARPSAVELFDPTQQRPALIASVDLETYLSEPCVVAVRPGGQMAYVAGTKLEYVHAIDLSARRVVASARSTLPVAQRSCGLAVAPRDGRVYVVDSSNRDVAVLDPDDLHTIHHIPVPPQPFAIAIPCGEGCATPPCRGDCSGDARISVDEIVVAVSRTLPPPASFACGDSGSPALTPGEVVLAVVAALEGCQPEP